MRSDGTEFMRASDAVTWLLEADPELRSTVVAVVWLDSTPDWDAVTARVDALSRQVVRMRQRVEEAPFRLSSPRWVYDDRFDLTWHLRRTATASPHSEASVLELARSEAMTGFDRTRPLWVFTLVEGVERGRAAMIMKMHHSLTDGQDATKLAPLLFDSVRHAAPAPLPAISEPIEARRPIVAAGILHDWGQAIDFAGDRLRSAVPAGVRALRNPIDGVRAVVDTAKSIGSTVAPVTETKSPVMRGRGLGRTLKMITVDLADLKRAAKAADATVDAAFLAGVGGGLRRYHELPDTAVDKVRVTVPIDNRTTLTRFAIPVSERDPIVRMNAIAAESRKARDAKSLAYANEIAFALDLLPTDVTSRMYDHVDVIASNVAGLAKKMYLVGAQVTAESVFGPTMGSAANLTLMSYAGTCTIGITLDSAAVPDADAFVACLRWGFEEVCAVKRRSNRWNVSRSPTFVKELP